MAEGTADDMGLIIEALVARTRQGQVEWSWEPSRARCVAEFENGRVLLHKDSDDDTVVTVEDKLRITLEAINVGYPQFRPLRGSADRLYELARRSALQIDAKLDSILQEITN